MPCRHSCRHLEALLSLGSTILPAPTTPSRWRVSRRANPKKETSTGVSTQHAGVRAPQESAQAIFHDIRSSDTLVDAFSFGRHVETPAVGSFGGGWNPNASVYCKNRIRFSFDGIPCVRHQPAVHHRLPLNMSQIPIILGSCGCLHKNAFCDVRACDILSLRIVASPSERTVRTPIAMAVVRALLAIGAIAPARGPCRSIVPHCSNCLQSSRLR